MVKVKKIDTPKPEKTKLYLGTFLLSVIPFVGLAFSINGLIRSTLKVIRSRKTKHIDKRAVTGTLISFVALLISIIAINAVVNPVPGISLNSAKTNVDGTSYVFSGEISDIDSEASKLTINDINIQLNNGEFSHKVDLREGDNIFNLVAINHNGEAKRMVTIHRTTKAEFAARAETERLVAKKKAKVDAESKLKADAEAKQKAATVAKAKAKLDAVNQAKAIADATAKAQADAKAAAEALKPRHTYDAFYDWVTTKIISSNGNELSRWSNIISQCDLYADQDGDGDQDMYFDKACLQDKYKDYIKPSAFDYGSSKVSGGGWMCPAGELYHYICSRYFDLETHVRCQEARIGFNVDEERDKAEVIYNEIALTKGGN